jgi:hypothetical protein
MCSNCRNIHAEAMKQANEHMDAQGVPEDSVLRGMADIHLACNENPILGILMGRCYPSTETLLESPIISNSIDLS